MPVSAVVAVVVAQLVKQALIGRFCFLSIDAYVLSIDSNICLLCIDGSKQYNLCKSADDSQPMDSKFVTIDCLIMVFDLMTHSTFLSK
jgi:hypothetical protein